MRNLMRAFTQSRYHCSHLLICWLVSLAAGVTSFDSLSAEPFPEDESDQTGKAKRPNIVFILTDNHGAWTLGCYGNPF